MPIHMDGFRLFSKEYPSSFPLCLAYKAAELADPDRAGCFLYHLRYATVTECRPTTQLEEILAVVQRTGIDQKAFLQEYHGDRAEKALDEDQKLGRQLGIRSLPAYLIRYQDRAMLFQTFSYQDFVSMIEKTSQGNIRSVSVSATEDTLRKLLTAHPLISPIEIREAFDLRDMDEVKQCLQPFLERQEIRIRNVAHGWFVERKPM